jgi:hypothetical protein
VNYSAPAGLSGDKCSSPPEKFLKHWGQLAVGGLLLLLPAYARAETEAAITVEKGGLEFSEEEMTRALAALDGFRDQRLSGDYTFRFDLRHLPRKGTAISYHGQLWGTWNRYGPVTRVRVDPSLTDGGEVVDLLLKSGATPAAWAFGGEGGVVRSLAGEELYQPLLEGIVYTPFDLQMPFVFWNRFIYEGETRRKGRQVFAYLMYPPDDAGEANGNIGAVRLFLDQKFNALVRAEILDRTGALKKTFKIVSFKKVQNQWIVKSVDLVDEESRNKTRFTVVSAVLNRKFLPRLFSSESLGEGPVDGLEAGDFQYL